MNRKTETAGFPYADRPMWLYSRSSDKRMFVLIQQMRNLLEESKSSGGASIGWSSDRNPAEIHPALKNLPSTLPYWKPSVLWFMGSRKKWLRRCRIP